MSFMETMLTLGIQALGGIYAPSRFRVRPRRLLVHISDTPSFTYPALERLFKAILPKVIIHTGDLADEVKLELFPAFTERYHTRVSELLAILRATGASTVIAAGNHDDLSFLRASAPWCQLVESAAVVSPAGFRCAVAHRADEALRLGEEYTLFGHDLGHKSSFNLGPEGPKILLNGIEAISVIDLDTRVQTALPWPSGTNQTRLGRFKTGL